MSRFFNESRKSRQSTAFVAERTGMDVQEAVTSLKARIESQSVASAVVAEPNYQPLIHDLTAEVAEVRLKNCRPLHLPEDNDKSFLAEQYNLSMQAAVEAYRTLRTRLVKQQSRQGTRSLVITSAAQGDGKTLTTLNLALCYARIENWPVLVVDADLRSKGLSRLLGNPPAPGLSELLQDKSPPETAIYRTDTQNLWVLPAGMASTPPPELFSSSHWKDLIGWCSESFRMVIIDSPPMLNLADFELIAGSCESVMLVVRAGATPRESMKKVLAQIEAGKLAGVVLNSTHEPQKSYYQYGKLGLK